MIAKISNSVLRRNCPCMHSPAGSAELKKQDKNMRPLKKTQQLTSLCFHTFIVVAIFASLSLWETGCQENTPQKRVDSLTEAVTRNPEDAELYYQRGLAYGELGRSDEELGDLTKAITLGDKHAKVYALRGRIYFARAKYDDAIPDFSVAIGLGDTSLLPQRALSYLLTGQYVSALGDFAQVAEVGQANKSQYVGDCYFYMGKYDSALSEWQRGKSMLEVSMGKSRPTPSKLLEMGFYDVHIPMLLVAARRYHDAIVCLDSLIRQKRSPIALLYYIRGVANFEMRNGRAAMNDFRTSISLDSTWLDTSFPMPYYLAAVASANTHRVGKAIDYLREAMKKGFFSLDLLKANGAFKKAATRKYRKLFEQFSADSVLTSRQDTLRAILRNDRIVGVKGYQVAWERENSVFYLPDRQDEFIKLDELLLRYSFR